MFHKTRKITWALIALLSLTLTGWAAAQDGDDPPTEAARLSNVQGNVSIQQAGTDQWAQAEVNFPLGPGDRVVTDQDSRAEVEIGQTYVRLGANADFSVVSIDEGRVVLGLSQGSAHVHVFALWPDQQVEISTPNGGIEIAQAADLRLDIYPNDGVSVFTNYWGNSRVFGAGDFSQYLGNNSALQVAGVNPVYPQWTEMNGRDDLDAWSNERDQRIEHSQSARYVNPGIAGFDELDAAGYWDPETDYGPVWYPRDVPYGWTPYHYGHWVHRGFWGWVWVEDESWGYAPFHYGRWVVVNGRWGWVPGPARGRPVWSPALVVFAGGVHVGGVGVSVWFPLGPGEAYHPWYHCSPRYVDQVNITNIRESRVVHVQNTYVNVTNVTNITYVNQTRGAVAVNSNDFAAGRHVGQGSVHVDANMLAHAQVNNNVALPSAPKQPQIFNRPTHTVNVSQTRPVLVNSAGQQFAAQPNAKTFAPPVQRTPPPAVSNPQFTRKVVAPPSGQPAFNGRPATSGNNGGFNPQNHPGGNQPQFGGQPQGGPQHGQPGGNQPQINSAPQHGQPSGNQQPQEFNRPGNQTPQGGNQPQMNSAPQHGQPSGNQQPQEFNRPGNQTPQGGNQPQTNGAPQHGQPGGNQQPQEFNHPANTPPPAHTQPQVQEQTKPQPPPPVIKTPPPANNTPKAPPANTPKPNTTKPNTSNDNKDKDKKPH